MEKLQVNADRYPNTVSRRSYVTNRLKGKAAAFAEQWLVNEDEVSAEHIINRLEGIYTDPNIVAYSRQAYQDLKQGRSNVDDFLNDFRSLAIKAKVSEVDQMIDLRTKCSEVLQNMMAAYEPDTIENFIKHIQKINLRRVVYTNRTQAAPVTGKQTYAAIAAGTTVESTKTTTTTKPRVKDPRHDNNICYACGGPDHIARYCPASEAVKQAHQDSRKKLN